MNRSHHRAISERFGGPRENAAIKIVFVGIAKNPYAIFHHAICVYVLHTLLHTNSNIIDLNGSVI